jgi:hypothetical protein
MGKQIIYGVLVYLSLTAWARADFLGLDWNPLPFAGILLLLLILIGIAIQKTNENKKKMLKEMAEEEARVKALPTLISCPICKKEISRAATTCPSCGHPINPQPIETSRRSWNPGVAAVLSLFIPGAGQVYRGQTGAGILWLIIVVGGYFLFIIPGVVLHLICIFNAARAEK